jgi:tRNA modification GTPase
VIDASASDESWREAQDLVRPGDIAIFNKVDRAAGGDRRAAEAWLAHVALERMDISVTGDRGVDALDALLHARAVEALSGGEFPAVTRERHRLRLTEARSHLARALSVLGSAELAAEDLRLAARALGRVAGRVDAEDILDVVFASFCIGK